MNDVVNDVVTVVIPGRSYRDRLCNALDMSPGQQATRARLLELLGWTDAVLDREVAEAKDDPQCPLSVASGGRVIRYRGSERWGGADGVGLYSDVQRILTTYWLPRRR